MQGKDKFTDQKHLSDEIDLNTDETAEAVLSRRQVLAGSTGAVAVASAVATAGVLAPTSAEAKWPKGAPVSDVSQISPETFDVDPSNRWTTKPGDLYNEGRGFGDREVTGWKNRNVYGATVGIVQIPAHIPMLPGDVGNATTFDYPVLYESIGDVDPFWVLSSEPHPEVLKRTIIASRRLVLQGVRSIIGNCGFFANYQPEVAKVIDVPFFNGSLMQVPMLLTSIGANKKVGVLTANGPLLVDAPALKNCGVSKSDMDRVVIYGAEKGTQMNRITGEEGSFNPEAFKQELVNLAVQMVEEHPDIEAVVLECTEFPPHAYAIQDAIRRSVWDFTTMADFMHAGAMRRPFTGWM